MTIRPWCIVRGDRIAERHFTRAGAARSMAHMKKTLQRCSDRLSYSRENDHFREILERMGDDIHVERRRA